MSSQRRTAWRQHPAVQRSRHRARHLLIAALLIVALGLWGRGLAEQAHATPPKPPTATTHP